MFSSQFLTAPAPDNYEDLVKSFRRQCLQRGHLEIDDDNQLQAEPDHVKLRELVSSPDYARYCLGVPDYDRLACGQMQIKDEPCSKNFRGS